MIIGAIPKFFKNFFVPQHEKTHMTILEREDVFKRKLLSGLKKSYKSGQSIKGPRISVTSGLGKTVVRNSHGKCQVCGARYDDPHKFTIHHIDGNRTNNEENNLALIRADYHLTIHGQANVTFRKFVEKNPPVPKPKSKPKPRVSSKSEFSDVNVLDRWRIAEQRTQDKWKNDIHKSLKILGYDF